MEYHFVHCHFKTFHSVPGVIGKGVYQFQLYQLLLILFSIILSITRLLVLQVDYLLMPTYSMGHIESSNLQCIEYDTLQET